MSQTTDSEQMKQWNRFSRILVKNKTNNCPVTNNIDYAVRGALHGPLQHITIHIHQEEKNNYFTTPKYLVIQSHNHSLRNQSRWITGSFCFGDNWPLFVVLFRWGIS